ncbi:MAG: type 4a pilus biogenesis protein PilO [Patescibacteria group bacterium]
MNKPIIIAICFIAVIAFSMGLIMPKYQVLQLKQAEVDAKQRELENREEYYQEIARISEELKQKNEEVSKISSAFPDEVSAPSMLDFFQRKASDSGLILKQASDISSSPNSKDSAIKENTITLSLSGFYHDFKNFLSVLENSARIIEVDNISFSSPGRETSPFSFEIVVKFYSH